MQENTLAVLRMEHHLHCLEEQCRVCGGLLSGQRVSYECDKYSLKMLKVDTSNDDNDIHPKKFCHKCYCCLKRVEQNTGTEINIQLAEWATHTNNCDTCQRQHKKFKGGRPPKAKRGRQKSSGVSTGHHLSSICTLPKFSCNRPLDLNRFCKPPPPIVKSV